MNKEQNVEGLNVSPAIAKPIVVCSPLVEIKNYYLNYKTTKNEY